MLTLEAISVDLKLTTMGKNNKQIVEPDLDFIAIRKNKLQEVISIVLINNIFAAYFNQLPKVYYAHGIAIAQMSNCKRMMRFGFDLANLFQLYDFML